MQVVMVNETIVESIGRDAVTFVTLLGSVGIGVLVDSTALQWIAGLTWCVWFIALVGNASTIHRKTPQEAADWLRDKFGVRAT